MKKFVMMEQIIKPLVDYNFTVDEYPVFKFLPMEKASIDLFKLWKELVTENTVKQTQDDEKHIREALDMPVRGILADNKAFNCY